MQWLNADYPMRRSTMIEHLITKEDIDKRICFACKKLALTMAEANCIECMRGDDKPFFEPEEL
jgi:hypothetical protein